MYKYVYHCTGPHLGSQSSSAVIGASLSYHSSCGSQLASAVWKQVIYIIYVYMTLIGVHEMYGLMHSNQDHVTNCVPLTHSHYLATSQLAPPIL